MRAMVRNSALAFALVLAAGCAEDARPPRESADPVAAVPSTVAPPATSAVPSATGPMPAPGAITFLGFGPAHWGASEAQVRQAWGKDLEASPGEPGACRYLFPLPRSPGGYRLAFMVEGGRFVRADVRAPAIVAPGGGRVGLDREALRRLYPAATEQPNKYVEGGLDVRVVDPVGGQGVAVFEVNPAGKVTAWRVGVPPQVDYVEGCS